MPEPVGAERPRLLPFLLGKYPSYFIYGPIAFTAGTDDFVALIGAARSGIALSAFSELGNLLLVRRSEPPAFPARARV